MLAKASVDIMDAACDEWGGFDEIEEWTTLLKATVDRKSGMVGWSAVATSKLVYHLVWGIDEWIQHKGKADQRI